MKVKPYPPRWLSLNYNHSSLTWISIWKDPATMKITGLKTIQTPRYSNLIWVQLLTDEGLVGWCQANANQSPKCVAISLSGRQLAPFGQSSGAVLLENIAAVELTVLIEMVVNRSMSGGKLLQSFDVSEPSHRALSSAERLV